FRSLPIARWAPLAGAVLGDMVRYLISVAITIGFGMILGFRVTTSALSALAGCLLLLAFALALCWASALIGLLVKTPQGVQAFGFIAFFPLVFGSNLLAPTGTMPGWLQAFVKVNPMTLLTKAAKLRVLRACRGGALRRHVELVGSGAGAGEEAQASPFAELGEHVPGVGGAE